jgi:hypothetical protein
MLRKIKLEVETEDYPDQEEFTVALEAALKNFANCLRSATYTLTTNNKLFKKVEVKRITH